MFDQNFQKKIKGELCMKLYPEIGQPKNLTDILIGYGNTYNIPHLKNLNKLSVDGKGYEYYISLVAVSYINTFFVIHGPTVDTIFGFFFFIFPFVDLYFIKNAKKLIVVERHLRDC